MEEHSENFNKEIGNIKKESTRAKEYNNVSDKYTEGNQQQIRWCRRKHQWTVGVT